MQTEFPRVVAAAVRDEDSGVVYHLPPPARHNDIGQHILESNIPMHSVSLGFLLSDGSFADQYAARKYALANNQFKPKNKRHRPDDICLLTSDLW